MHDALGPHSGFVIRTSAFGVSISIFQFPFSNALPPTFQFLASAFCGKLDDYWARFLRSVWRSPRVLEAPAE